ncbi:MAG: hypothetical protein WCJ60_00005 [bacterium]
MNDTNVSNSEIFNDPIFNVDTVPQVIDNEQDADRVPKASRAGRVLTAIAAVGISVLGMNGTASAVTPEDCVAQNMVPVYQPQTGDFLGCAIKLDFIPGPIMGGGGYENPSPKPKPKPKPAPTTTTQPKPRIGERDEDGDGFKVTYNIDTGAIVSTGFEFDDHSAGAGQVGLELVTNDMAARGLDPASLTGEQTLIALSTDPASFKDRFALIYDVLPTTTTAAPTTIPNTTKIGLVESSTTNELFTVTSISDSLLSDNNKSKKSDGTNWGIIVLGAAVIGGAIELTRRRSRSH